MAAGRSDGGEGGANGFDQLADIPGFATFQALLDLVPLLFNRVQVRRIRRQTLQPRPGGLTWEPTRELFPFDVMPQTQRLGNGAVVASFVRPGVQLGFAQDAAARNWSALLPLIAGAATNVSVHSCGDTRMVPLDEHSLLVVHSDYQWPDEEERGPAKPFWCGESP